MAKLTMDSAIKYAVLGVGAVAIPAIAGSVAMINDLLVKIPYWGTALYAGITLGGVVLAGTGIGLIDSLFFK